MTQQSYPNNSEEVAVSGASSSTNSASTSSTDVYPLPFSIGQKEIVLNNDERSLVAEVPANDFLAAGTNVCVTNSSNVDVGHRTTFNEPVTIYQYIQGSRLAEIQDGAIGHDEVECNKNVRVVPPPPVSPISKPTNDRGLFRRHFKAIMILLTAVTVVCAITLITLRLVGSKKPSYIPTTTEEPGSTTVEPSKVHYSFNKTQWGGRDLPKTEAIDEPVRLVIIKHTKTKTCLDLSSCFMAMQDLQNTDVGIYHFPDIRYNFVIGGDGNIYEGRGWGARNEQMNNTIDIAYMGNFNEDVPSGWMASAGLFLVVKGMFNGHLDPAYAKVVCHNQTENVDSPGEYIYREVIRWKYYSNETYPNSSRRNDLQ